VANPRRTSGNRSFALVSRLIQEKNLYRLAAAYQLYRKLSEQLEMEPWPLRCYGDGPLEDFLRDQPGIEICGFIQPSDLPAQLARASALVLPSTFEPWGVVVHEAASAGLGLLLSRNVGASVHLLQDGYNGWLFDPLNVADIARAMLRFASLPPEGAENISRASSSLALQYTPARWAAYLLERSAELIEQQLPTSSKAIQLGSNSARK
jgi:glycosyltransferase involved in cell wall biosynthesis